MRRYGGTERVQVSSSQRHEGGALPVLPVLVVLLGAIWAAIVWWRLRSPSPPHGHGPR
jgi:hypothetical protein